MYYLWLVVLFAQCNSFNYGYNVGASRTTDYKFDDHDIIRPCPHFNLDCVRVFFKQHSTCAVSHGPMPDPLMLEKYKFYLPFANTTYELHNTGVRGLNGKIVEFYVNKKTHKVILAARMKEILLESGLIVAKYARKAKEQIELIDSGSGNYGSVTFTTVFPDLSKLQLSEAETSSYIEDSNMKYYLGPKMSTSLDPSVHEMHDTIRKNLGMDLRESFVYQGPIFMGNFIQHMICDFGMKLEHFFLV